MANVLIRDVPPDDLEELRSAAIEHGMSLQSYLLDAVHTQAAYLRRRAALQRTAERLAGRPAVSDEERQAVLDVLDAERADWANPLIPPFAP